MAESYSRATKILAALAGFLFIQAFFRSCAALVQWANPVYVDVNEQRVELPVGTSRYWMVALFLMAGAGVGVVVTFLARTLREESQKLRDQIAQRLADEAHRHMASIAAGEKIDAFVLYLRPFRVEKHLHTAASFLSPRTYFLHPRVRFDYVLHERLSAKGIPLLAIGIPGDEQGAGNVSVSDAEWRDRFRELAHLARTIVVVPGRQPGITSEIRWLRVSGLLGNAVFFKPNGYPRREWETLRTAYETEEDIELPEYSPQQISFRLYSSGIAHDVHIWRDVRRNHAIQRGNKQLENLLIHGTIEDNERI
jgi:hypothetical protein